MYPTSSYSYGPQAYPAAPPSYPGPVVRSGRPPKANPVTAVTAGSLAVMGSLAHGFTAIFAGLLILAGSDIAASNQDSELATRTGPDDVTVSAAIVVLPTFLCVSVALIVGAVLLFSRIAAGRYVIIGASAVAMLPWLLIVVTGNLIGGVGVLFPLAAIVTAAWSSTGRWIREQRVPYTLGFGKP